MGVGAGEALAVWRKLAVKHCTVTLAFDLDKRTTRYRHVQTLKNLRLFCVRRCSAHHVEVVLCVCPTLQIPDEHVSIVASRQDDPGVKGMRFQHKHLGLVTLGILSS